MFRPMRNTFLSLNENDRDFVISLDDMERDDAFISNDEDVVEAGDLDS